MSEPALRVALCFPGQGSQAAAMAAGLEATELGARLLAVAASAGVDLGPAFGGDEELIRPTEIAQPALVFTEVVLAAALPGDLDVVAVAGHSVGELAALAAAGALDPEAALRLAVERGRLMAAMREGTMAAVLGLDAEAVARLCAGSGGTVVVANLNAPGQVVVSGSVEAVAGLSAMAREAGARRVIPLRVSGAFHSPLMADAAAAFVRVLDGVDMRAPAVPVIANVDASPVTGAAGLRERLGRQMVSAVRWSDSVERLVELGADVLVEVGPGEVLTGLARRIAPQVRAVGVSSLAAAAALAERLGADGRG
ncbi:MAG: acyltransferase domain-containing protein [Candidatus Dormibacteria bacterium]